MAHMQQRLVLSFDKANLHVDLFDKLIQLPW